MAPMALPVLPVDSYISYAAALGIGPSTAERKELAELPQFYADMHGWETIVDTVAGVYETLPLEDRKRAAIFTFNYGDAGAIDLLGRKRGLPPAIGGHDNYCRTRTIVRCGSVASCAAPCAKHGLESSTSTDRTHRR